MILVLLASAVVASDAGAQPPRTGPILEGTSTCPTPASVAAVIARLTSPQRRAQISALSRVSVVDEGAHQIVSVFTGSELRARQYDDPVRDCARRAETAAIFAVLTLMPPELEPPRTESTAVLPPQPPALDEAARSTAVSSRAVSLPWLTLEFGIFADTAIGTNATELPFAWGAGLRAIVGRGALGLVVAGSYGPEIELTTPGVRLGLRRISFELGARVRDRVGQLELAGDVVLVAIAARLRGIDLLRSETRNAFDLGGGLRASAAFTHGWLAPFFELHALVMPAPTDIRALPAGVAGHMPMAWFGASIGVCLAL